MNKEYISSIIEELKRLENEFLLSQTITSKTKRESEQQKVRLEISLFSSHFSGELKAFLYTKVDENALSYKWADEFDLKRCIKALQDWLDTNSD